MCPNCNCNCNCNCNIPEHAFSPNPNVSPELSVTTIFEFRHCAIQFQDWASSFETERFPSTGCNISTESRPRQATPLHYRVARGPFYCLLTRRETPPAGTGWTIIITIIIYRTLLYRERSYLVMTIWGVYYATLEC